MRRKIRAGVLCVLVVLTACSRGGEGAGSAGAAAGADSATGGAAAAATAPDGAARAASARAAAGDWPKVEGRWTHGDVDSQYVAHFDAGELRYLVEEASAGDGGTRRSEYWFDGGELYYYAGEKPSAYGGAGPGALPPSVPIVAEFRGAEVVRAVAREHYGEKKLADEAVQQLRRHAAALAGAAQDEWSAQQAK